jgi:hypothetical protein
MGKKKRAQKDLEENGYDEIISDNYDDDNNRKKPNKIKNKDTIHLKTQFENIIPPCAYKNRRGADKYLS